MLFKERFRPLDLAKWGSLGLVAAITAACTEPQVQPEPTAPDTIYFNAVIHTQNPDAPQATAIAVAGERIFAVGDDADLAALADENTRREDLGGAFVMPGIIDGHAHPAWGGLMAVYHCVFPATAFPAEVRDTLSNCVKDAPAEEVWVQGGTWGADFFTQYRIDNPRLWLDEISADKAVALKDDSGHNYWLNSKALELLDIDENTPVPAGAIFQKDAAGQLNGVMIEAFGMLAKRLPAWTAEQYKAGIKYAQNNAHQYGITGWKDASSTEEEAVAYHALDMADELRVNVATCLYRLSEQIGGVDVVGYRRMRDSYDSDQVHTRCVKIFLDGIPTTSRTAAMMQDYTTNDGDDVAHNGTLHMPPEDLAKNVTLLDALGFTVKIHTAGDRSVHEGLNAIAAARKTNGMGGGRHELAHAGFVQEKDIPRFAALNVVADLSPHLWFPSPITQSVVDAVGPRGKNYFPTRAMLDADAPLLMGSDWPSVAPDMNPWIGLEALITRADPVGGYPGPGWVEQAITLEEGLSIMTLAGARAMGMEDHIGSLQPGKSADFVVLSANPFEVEVTDLSELRAVRTFFQGEEVFSR